VDGEELFAVAVDLVTHGSTSFKRTARRFSLCAHDAEDAYQRGLEILLTKAPTARREELRPWLHTVIKHEALALRRQRERSVSSDDDADGAGSLPALDRGPDEAATGRERVHRTAEALGTLKPSEMQCLVLKALGYSYDEISARTGYSWTKVNRSLTEGRRRFFERFGEIASGDACSSYVPLLSAACDGHSGAEDERRLRAHLAACSGCRAALREYRSAPARLAELLPPFVILPLLDRTSLWSRISDWFSVSAGERATAIGIKLQQSAEVVSAQKAAAVVASTAAIAGGGAAVKHEGRPDRERAVRAEQRSKTQPAQTRIRALRAAVLPQAGGTNTPAPAPAPPRRRHTSKESEFGFESTSMEEATATSEPPAASAATASGAGPREFSAGGGQAAGGEGGGEFGP
jgi:RNA polymerase sigma factor (sigma-70 family)